MGVASLILHHNSSKMSLICETNCSKAGFAEYVMVLLILLLGRDSIHPKSSSLSTTTVCTNDFSNHTQPNQTARRSIGMEADCS